MSQSDWLFTAAAALFILVLGTDSSQSRPQRQEGKWKLRAPDIKSWPEIGWRHADRGRRFSPLIGLVRDLNTFNGSLSWATAAGLTSAAFARSSPRQSHWTNLFYVTAQYLRYASRSQIIRCGIGRSQQQLDRWAELLHAFASWIWQFHKFCFIP